MASALEQDDAWLTAYAAPPPQAPPEDRSALGYRNASWVGDAAGAVADAHNAYQDWLDPSGRSWRTRQADQIKIDQLPPQDTVEKPYTPPFSGDKGIYNRPTGSAQGDVVLPSEGRFDSSQFSPQVPITPQPSTNQDTRDYNTYRATGQDAPVGLQNISYAGDVLSPYARDNARLGQPSSVENVGDELARRFQTMTAAMPPEVKARLEIHSGFRSPERNAEVYRQYGQPPSRNSRHSHGMALDLGNDPVVLDWIGKNPQYGLGFPLRYMGPDEYNHLEMIDPKTGARAPIGGRPQERTGSSTPPPQQQAPAAEPVKTPKKPLHPIEIFEDAVKEFPIIHSQGLTAGPGESTEYWPAGEPGTQARPRPAFIPIDQSGMEIGPDARPLDVLGDVVSHHMVNTDPVIKKTYEDFSKSLTDTQKELLQAQYMYYRKNEGETRPYDQWEKTSGLPAYFRGYPFQQWPQDFNQTAYTPQQRYGLDRMMDYLRGNKETPTALEAGRRPGTYIYNLPERQFQDFRQRREPIMPGTLPAERASPVQQDRFRGYGTGEV